MRYVEWLSLMDVDYKNFNDSCYSEIVARLEKNWNPISTSTYIARTVLMRLVELAVICFSRSVYYSPPYVK